MKKGYKIGLCILTGLILTTGCGKIPKLENGQEAVVTIKDGDAISVDSLYNKMKKTYALNTLLDMIDTQLFDKIYKDDDEQKEYIESQVEQMKYYYDSYYSTQFKSFEIFINQYYGVQDQKELEEVLKLNYRRDKATEDYLKDIITNKEIEKYYDEEIIGDMKASHILIEAEYDKDASDDEIKEAKDKAKSKAEDIIKELKGLKDKELKEKFAELAKKYSSDGSSEDGGDLGYFNKGDMVSNFEKATIKLTVGEYTSEPVETEYGYHIILKTGEKDKKALKEVRKDVIKALVDKKKEEDENVQQKALIALRQKNDVTIQDKDLKKQYKTYCEQYEK